MLAIDQDDKKIERSRQPRKEEQKFLKLAENSADYIVRYDSECRKIYANPQAINMLTLLCGNVPLGKTPTEAYPGAHFEKYETVLRRVLETGQALDLEFLLPDYGEGTQHHLIRMIAEKNDAGIITGALVIGKDITAAYERKQTIRQLQEAYHFNEQLLNAIPDPVFVKDRKHRWMLVNDAMCSLLGRSRSELIGKSDFDILPPNQSAVFWEKDELVFKTGQENINDEVITDSKGRLRNIQTKKTLINNNLLIGIIRDLTSTLANKLLLSEAQTIARLGSWDWDVVNDSVEWSDMAYEIYTPDKRPDSPGFEEFKQSVHPEDRDTVVAAVKLAFEQDIPYDIEHRVVSKSKGIRTVQAQGKVYRDESGKPVRMVGTVLDITERKRADDQLRMAASVFEAAREGITITDPEGVILDINPAFACITGYAKDEVLGKRSNILSSGKHTRDFYEEMWKQLKTSHMWSGEIVNRRKNGELYSEHLDITSVKDESGNIKHFIGIFSDISHLKQHEQHLQHIAHHDYLTGLPNRLLLTERLSTSIANTRRERNMMAILYLDLDNFKPINDEYSHEFGDSVLVEVSRRLVTTVRHEDTVARIGGDEFIVLLTGISDTEECELAAQRLLDVISHPIIIENESMSLTASIGISLFPNDGQYDADILLRYADQAMYFAKAAGRNNYIFFDSYAREKIRNQNQTIHELRQALNANEISVYYQPIIDLTSNRFTKAEALVRWHHSSGLIPPSQFIPIAENGGLIHEIGDLVFKRAARIAHLWNHQEKNSNGEKFKISINRSPRQFFKSDSVDIWEEHLQNENCSGELLIVEITEGLLMDDRQEVLDQLNQLRNSGITISLDDFGTGYSALSYLKKFKLDYIKIDKSFINDIATSTDDLAIVESIIAMAKRLGIKVVAEGVETEEQAKLLKAAGCDMAQGFFYAKPMSEEEFLRFVSEK